MISQESQNLIRKKWPGIEDNRILLEFVRQEVYNLAFPNYFMSRYNYPSFFDTPEYRKKYFYQRAKFNHRLMLLSSIVLVGSSIAVICLILSKYGLSYRPMDLIPVNAIFLGIGIFAYYWNKRKLLTCYDELLREANESSF